MARLPSVPLVNRCARWSIFRCSSADTTKSGLGWVSMKNLDKQVDRQSGRQSDRQADRQTGRQSGRQTYHQMYKYALVYYSILLHILRYKISKSQ